MNTETTNEKRVLELIENAKKIGILPSKVAGVDSFAAGVGIYHQLKKEGKSVSFVYQGQAPEAAKSTIAEAEVLSNFLERELVVSIDYSGTPAAKINWETKDEVVYARISPVSKDYDLSKVKAVVKSHEFDLLICIGAHVPTDYGQVYHELADEFRTAKIINIDNTEMNMKYGSVNVIDPLEHSLSMLSMSMLIKVGWKLNADSAKAFLTGVSQQTI